MSFVVVNVVTVPQERRAEFEERFDARAGLVEKQPGFEAFEFLRPEAGDEYFVYTRWRSKDDFERWVTSDDFQKGHVRHSGEGPVGTASEIKTFHLIAETAARKEV